MKKSIILVTLLLTLISTSVFAATFKDLSSNHWAYGSISEMTKKGILVGYPDGTFAPEKSITRAEFAKILVLTLDLDENQEKVDFIDVAETHWAYKYVNTASKYLSGYSNGKQILYLPNDEAVREDVAVAVVVAAGLQDAKYNPDTLNKFSDKNFISENLKKYVAIAAENNLMNGNADGTFNPKGKLTRAEVCKLMMNTVEELEKIAIVDRNPEGENNFDLSNFAGEWIAEEDASKNIYEDGGRSLTIEVKDSNTISFNYYVLQAAPASRTALINIENIKLDANHSGSFEWEDDGWANRGEGTIKLDSDKVIINIMNVQESENAMWGIFDSKVIFTKKVKNELPEFKFDVEKGTVDLGEEWDKYYIAHKKYPNRFEYLYVPSQRVLNRHYGFTFDEECLSNSTESFGKELFVVLKSNENIYTEVELVDQFADVSYNQATEKLDLGENWEKYLIVNSDEYNAARLPERHTIYQPSQRYLNKKPTKVEGSGTKTTDGVGSSYFTYVILKQNRNVFKIIETPARFDNKDNLVISAQYKNTILSDLSIKKIEVFFKELIKSGTMIVTDSNGKIVAKSGGQIMWSNSVLAYVREDLVPNETYKVTLTDVITTKGNKLNTYSYTFKTDKAEEEEIEPEISTKTVYGDVNEDGKIDIMDALTLQKHIENFSDVKITSQGLKNADVNLDGKINATDTVIILSVDTGWDIKLPAEGITVYGDVNEDGWLNNADVTILSNYISGKTSLNVQAKKNADFNGDGKVNELDVLGLEGYITLKEDTKNQVLLNPEKTLYGDANEDGKIQAKDSLLILKYASETGNVTITNQGLKNADVNLDGKVNGTDAQIVIYVTSGHGIKLPAKDIIAYGDVDLNGKITSFDIEVLEATINMNLDLERSLGDGHKNADFNGDGIVDIQDVNEMKEYLGEEEEKTVVIRVAGAV